MCFTVSVNTTRELLEKRYGIPFTDPSHHKAGYYFNAYSLPELQIIGSDKPDRFITAGWGLIPFWIKDKHDSEKIRVNTFNARAETLREKPSFREPFRKRRCIIPVTGFFEWHEKDGKKYPFYITLRNTEIFSLAGIYDTWSDKVTRECLITFSIITVRANSVLEKIHNTKKRMPAILTPEDEKIWIDKKTPTQELAPLLKPFASDYIKAHSITPDLAKRSTDKNTPNILQYHPFDELDKDLIINK